MARRRVWLNEGRLLLHWMLWVTQKLRGDNAQSQLLSNEGVFFWWCNGIVRGRLATSWRWCGNGQYSSRSTDERKTKVGEERRPECLCGAWKKTATEKRGSTRKIGDRMERALLAGAEGGGGGGWEEGREEQEMRNMRGTRLGWRSPYVGGRGCAGYRPPGLSAAVVDSGPQRWL